MTPGLPQAAAACAGVLAAAILCAVFRAGDEGQRTPTADILGAVAIASLLLPVSYTHLALGICAGAALAILLL